MPSHAYFVDSKGNGDWYAAVAPTAPGESPQTAPDKWVKLEIPSIFETYVTARATAFLHAGREGQLDKGLAIHRLSRPDLEELIWRHGSRGAIAQQKVFTR